MSFSERLTVKFVINIISVALGVYIVDSMTGSNHSELYRAIRFIGIFGGFCCWDLCKVLDEMRQR